MSGVAWAEAYGETCFCCRDTPDMGRMKDLGHKLLFCVLSLVLSRSL